jgi:hypothetical protein
MIDRLTIHNYVQRLLIPVAIVGGAIGCGYIAATTSFLASLMIAMLGGGFLLLKGLRDITFGLIITLAIMNNFYDLLPSTIFSGAILNKSWDFGFIYMLIVSARFIPFAFVKRDETIPLFIKSFYLFLFVIIISFIVSLIFLPYPFIDTFRAFRDYLGYLLIPVLIAISDKNHSWELSVIFNRLIRFMSYICFTLLVLYNLQYLLQHQFFFGFEQVYRSSGREYIRSIPIFLMFSYFFFWLFLAQWLNGKRLAYWKTLYIILSCSATLFTFTRGLYLSIILFVLLLLFFMAKIRSVNIARFSLSIILTLLIISSLFISSLATPYYERMLSVTSDIQAINKNSTSKYRKRLVEDRINIIKKHNPVLGIGFVHPKYAFYDYGPFTGNHLPGELPTLWCADIAWANIIYQTGILGVAAFVLYIIAISLFIVRQIPKYKGELLFLQLASCFELLRNIVSMFNGAAYTYQTQNIALLIGISAYLHIVHSRNLRIAS